eukprot:gene1569-1990_t
MSLTLQAHQIERFLDPFVGFSLGDIAVSMRLSSMNMPPPRHVLQRIVRTEGAAHAVKTDFLEWR